MTTLREQFANELDRSLARISEAVAPYTRFVRAEAERMEEIRGELLAIHGESDRIRYAIDVLVPETGAIPALDSSSSPFASARAPLSETHVGMPPGTPVTDSVHATQLSSSPARPSPR